MVRRASMTHISRRIAVWAVNSNSFCTVWGNQGFESTIICPHHLKNQVADDNFHAVFSEAYNIAAYRIDCRVKLCQLIIALDDSHWLIYSMVSYKIVETEVEFRRNLLDSNPISWMLQLELHDYNINTLTVKNLIPSTFRLNSGIHTGQTEKC